METCPLADVHSYLQMIAYVQLENYLVVFKINHSINILERQFQCLSKALRNWIFPTGNNT